MQSVAAARLLGIYVSLLTTFIHCTSVLGSKESTLLDWLYLNGGKVDFSIVRPCDGCERGAFASKAFAPGDVVATVPFHSSIELGSGSSAEQAYRLLEALTLNATLQDNFKFFLGVLPGHDEVLLPEAYSDDEMQLLQTPGLERFIRQRRAAVEELYKSKGPGPAGISLNELKHMTGLVSSRKFLLGSERLVPAVDMLNHRETPNTEYDEVAGSVVLKAIKAVAAGEELFLDYKPGVLHRPDASLFLYGFVQDHEHPLLCATDLPTFLPFNPWRRTRLDDPPVSSAAPSWAEKYEYKRLAARLANMPTTEEHDLALLEGGSLDSWRQRLLVRFRVQRKRGLRQALQRMEQAWAAKSASPGAACQSNSSKAEPAGAQDGKADLISLQKCSPAGPAWAGTRTWTDMVAAAVAQADAWKEIAIPSAVFLTFVVHTMPLSVSAVVCLVVPVAVWLQL